MQQVQGRVVVLGGTGLLGGALAARLSSTAKHVLIADRRQPTDSGFDAVQLDITAPGALTGLMRDHAPDLVINAVNLATVFSARGHAGYQALIRYHAELFEALKSRTRPITYLQVGTTGSGGLGFDIPFTHGAALESQPIIHKAAFAGMSSQLLVLIARSFAREQVRVVEVKPGLAIFDERILVQNRGDMQAVTVDGGESGVYTADELALLTRYMGFSTVGRIADKVLDQLLRPEGKTALSAHDVVAAIDTSIVAQDPEDIRIRDKLLARMAELGGGELTLPVTGNLGPPTISRDLILAAICLAGQSTQGSLLRETRAYLRATQPELANWLAEQDLQALHLSMQAQIQDETRPWELVYASLREQALERKSYVE
jgi:hypothetical protein